MLALLGNIGMLELVLIAVIAVLVFGRDLPQAASKAYLQVRKLRNSLDDLRRESGIDRELRELERTVREAEWEARRAVAPSKRPAERPPSGAPLPLPPAKETPEASTPEPPPWESSGESESAAPSSDAPGASDPAAEAPPDEVKGGAS